MAETVSSFLDKSLIRNIKKVTQLSALQPNDTIQSAFGILARDQITALAVYNPAEKKFLGFVDTLDLAVFVVRVFAENFDKHPHLYDPKELQLRFNMPVKEVINASSRDVFQPVEGSFSLNFLISNFLQYGVHRVPVMENGNIVGIVSQSDVLKFLFKHTSNLTDIMTKRLAELGLHEGKVISISNEQTLMKAFSKILTNNITGLAVVDSHGQLVNNISASDLKGITMTSFYKLEIPIHEALLYNPNKLEPVTCNKHNTLGEIMGIIEKTGVHRIFVVDEDNKPVNVITLTDILKLFAHPYECL